MDPELIERLLKELQIESDYLHQRGYVFPALYEAVAVLLKHHMPD